MNKTSIEINDRIYAMPNNCAIVICIDGCEQEYLDVALSEGLMPNLSKIIEKGISRIAHSVIPSFTNPNNMSIATGQPPSIHGICGNYFYDSILDKEVMMNDTSYLRAPTLFSKFYEAGSKVAVITAKDKLRALLGSGLSFEQNKAICFSSECANKTTKKQNGIEDATKWLGFKLPEVYSSKLSEFVFASGVKILKEWAPDIMYLSTTDYIQHKFSPAEEGAKSFYSMIDNYLGQLDKSGATIVITADHGMKPKHDKNKKPSIIYIQDFLDKLLGKSIARVILPITDPYVIHHGSLGSFATIYLPETIDKSQIINKLLEINEVLIAVDREQAVKKFELPADRIGDITIISGENNTIGTTKDNHNLLALKEPLRSHGGITEQEVPFIVNKMIKIPTKRQIRNFDAFYYATHAACD